ncbi:hypothetical protein [Streptomyces sp. SID8499]|uniref:hypothetical protein n=1 Tax=Streptomyces sp. SID8499 TaxID=2706106 RepID=UPI0013CD4A36|nr:hypothetical protein [Streptomyces sp. SID8499]NED31085.1 hypothetical protein [Streptomyces sp. SID8499]
MTAKFLSAHCTINWHGVDDDTPPGHSVAIGTDAFGTVYLWLFKGTQPTDDAFIGSISVPARASELPAAYGPGGGFAGTVTDYATTLARLADRATTEE